MSLQAYRQYIWHQHLSLLKKTPVAVGFHALPTIGNWQEGIRRSTELCLRFWTSSASNHARRDKTMLCRCLLRLITFISRVCPTLPLALASVVPLRLNATFLIQPVRNEHGDAESSMGIDKMLPKTAWQGEHMNRRNFLIQATSKTKR